MQNARNWAKADAKVQLFSIHSKFFGNFFSKNTKVFGIIDKAKPYTLLIYIRLFKNLLDFIFAKCIIDIRTRVISIRQIEDSALIDS